VLDHARSELQELSGVEVLDGHGDVVTPGGDVLRYVGDHLGLRIRPVDYPVATGLAASPTAEAPCVVLPASDPANAASPKVKTLPSAATNQYPPPSRVGAIPTIGALRLGREVQGTVDEAVPKAVTASGSTEPDSTCGTAAAGCALGLACAMAGTARGHEAKATTLTASASAAATGVDRSAFDRRKRAWRRRYRWPEGPAPVLLRDIRATAGLTSLRG
jgi:hypothetical protein